MQMRRKYAKWGFIYMLHVNFGEYEWSKSGEWVIRVFSDTEKPCIIWVVNSCQSPYLKM